MERFESYQEMRQVIGERYQQQDLEEVIEILTWGLKAFPDHLQANVFNLALCQVQLSRMEQAVETLNYGLDRGIWFGPFEMAADVWEPLREYDPFGDVQVRYEILQDRVQKTASPLLDVDLPEGYSGQKPYPLFIALHGGGETVKEFKGNWKSPLLSNEFIVAYPQSSRVVSMDGYSWMGEPPDQHEITQVYQEILQEYPVDPDRVIIGGFSSGGHFALTLLLEEVLLFPFRGFVVLCPPVPDVVPIDAVERIVDHGHRGVLLTTEMDNRLKAQEKFAMVLESGGVPIRFEVFPDIGHWYPKDLDDKLDKAIGFILQSNEI